MSLYIWVYSSAVEEVRGRKHKKDLSCRVWPKDEEGHMARNMGSLEELRVLPLSSAERQQENVTLVLATTGN